MADRCHRARTNHSPLPVVAVILAVVNAVPWWASGRRRAKVRVERKLESWPEVAKQSA
jgi:hypothetical protein